MSSLRLFATSGQTIPTLAIAQNKPVTFAIRCHHQLDCQKLTQDRVASSKNNTPTRFVLSTARDYDPLPAPVWLSLQIFFQLIIISQCNYHVKIIQIPGWHSHPQPSPENLITISVFCLKCSFFIIIHESSSRARC
jgi:hypothetical protein